MIYKLIGKTGERCGSTSGPVSGARSASRSVSASWRWLIGGYLPRRARRRRASRLRAATFLAVYCMQPCRASAHTLR